MKPRTLWYICLAAIVVPAGMLVWAGVRSATR